MKDKAIILDLDGTVVNSPKQKLPSPEVISAVNHLQEKYHICAATGRVWSFAKPVLHALELTDPCIISAGTQICDPQSGDILWQKNIEPDTLKKVIAIFQEYPEWKLLHNDGTEEDYFHGGVTPSEFAATEPVYFLEQVFIPNKTAEEIYQKLSNIEGIACVKVVSQKPDCCDLHIVNGEATKEHAIEELLKIIHVEPQNTIGVGDGHNDLHLFNAVGHKVAMGNAVPELKKAADEVIGDVQDDGLASYLVQLKNE